MRTWMRIAIAVVFVVLALWTVFPRRTDPSFETGYRTTCPFAPTSTVSLLVPAALFWVYRNGMPPPT
jgi:hypothetical protein